MAGWSEQAHEADLIDMEIGLQIGTHVCGTCIKSGVSTTALVRMMPKAAILNGKLIGLEYWGCPVCLTLHFPISAEAKKQWGKRKQKAEAEQANRPAKRRFQVVEGGK